MLKVCGEEPCPKFPGLRMRDPKLWAEGGTAPIRVAPMGCELRSTGTSCCSKPRPAVADGQWLTHPLGRGCQAPGGHPGSVCWREVGRGYGERGPEGQGDPAGGPAPGTPGLSSWLLFVAQAASSRLSHTSEPQFSNL